jgi:hypothetical protein
MTASFTREQIAADFALWGEYVDPHAAMSREEFDALSLEAKLTIQNKTFGEAKVSLVDDPEGGCQHIGTMTLSEAPNDFLRDLIARALETGRAEAADPEGCVVRATRE